MNLAVQPGEELLPAFSAIQQRLNFRISAATLHRWKLAGVRGHRFPVVKIGGRLMTSIEAVDRWVAAIQPDATPNSTTSPKMAKRNKSTDKKLAELGV